MSFRDWLYSDVENPAIKGQWGLLHILTLVLVAIAIVAIALCFRGERQKNEKGKKIVLFVLAGLIFLFEIVRRIVNLTRGNALTFDDVLYILMPRPWCAISCWVVMASVFVNKKFFYNFVSITALLCGIIFFAYPSVGFNNEYILFENLYSIVTHALLVITSITLITLKFADFTFESMPKSLICLGGVYVYAALETWVLKIEEDPLYYLPGNDIMELFNLPYVVFLILYIVVLAIFWLSFYVIQNRKMVCGKLFKKNGE